MEDKAEWAKALRQLVIRKPAQDAWGGLVIVSRSLSSQDVDNLLLTAMVGKDNEVMDR